MPRFSLAGYELVCYQKAAERSADFPLKAGVLAKIGPRNWAA